MLHVRHTCLKLVLYEHCFKQTSFIKWTARRQSTNDVVPMHAYSNKYLH